MRGIALKIFDGTVVPQADIGKSNFLSFIAQVLIWFILSKTPKGFGFEVKNIKVLSSEKIATFHWNINFYKISVGKNKKIAINRFRKKPIWSFGSNLLPYGTLNLSKGSAPQSDLLRYLCFSPAKIKLNLKFHKKLQFSPNLKLFCFLL